MERTIVWLHNFRRVVTRWERAAYLYDGFVQLACLQIILKRFLRPTREQLIWLIAGLVLRNSIFKNRKKLRRSRKQAQSIVL